MTIYEKEIPKGSTEYYVILPDGNQLHEFIDWPPEPSLEQIKKLVEPLVDGHLEHVSVLHMGKARDMFVNEIGAKIPLLANTVATEIYRAWHLKKFPDTELALLPWIYGTAVLFGRKVWF